MTVSTATRSSATKTGLAMCYVSWNVNPLTARPEKCNT